MTSSRGAEDWVKRLSELKQYEHNGKRVPHKPLLVLLALGRAPSAVMTGSLGPHRWASRRLTSGGSILEGRTN
jgi:hypothetical protein